MEYRNIRLRSKTALHIRIPNSKLMQKHIIFILNNLFAVVTNEISGKEESDRTKQKISI